MSAPAISRRTLADAILERLQQLPGWSANPKQTVVSVYDTRPDPSPPLIKTTSLDQERGLVKPYVVLQLGAGGGAVAGERDLADEHVDLTAVHQVTCVAGRTGDLWDLVDQVDALLYRWAPVVEDLAFGRMRPPDGYDPGGARLDEKFTPPRLFVPLQYRLDVTT